MMNKHQSSTLLMTLAIIAASMPVLLVTVEALDLFDDAKAKEIKKTKSKKKDHSSEH